MRNALAPRLVHVHGDFAEAALATRAAKRRRVPVVMTVHSGLNLGHVRLSRLAFRGIDRFIALGGRVADDLLNCRVPEERITVMSSGLDWDLLNPFLAAPPPDHPRIVSVGSLNAMKDHETVIAAARELRATRNDLELVIVGEGRDRERLEALARRDTFIHFVGHVTRPEVYEIVSRSSVFTLASRRLSTKAEGVPTALLEAMALRRPCVVSSACTPDAIASPDSGTYITAAPGDSHAFALAIGTLLDDGDAAAVMGEKAANAVAALGWENIATRVEAVYEAALAGS
jgi:glycosyltransferase involved in cell wall biosynthesis